jgi:hypothetical protein
VEVSGWDASRTFFVEKTSLDGLEDGEQRIQLHRPVPKGAFVFLRPVQTLSADAASPIACVVDKVGSPDANGSRSVNLVRLRPRAAAKQTS